MAPPDPEAARMHETDVEIEDDAASYEEARGPHLPGALEGLPWLAWVFILLAIGDLAWFIARYSSLGSVASFDEVAGYVLQVVPSITAVLLPAILLVRHHDATTRAPTLLFGTILYALDQGLEILGEWTPLQSIFQGLTPASEDTPWLVPLAAAYNGLTSLVAIFGLTYIAVGLSQARRYEDRSMPLLSLLVPAAAILVTVVSILANARDLTGVPISPTLAAYLGSTVILGVLHVAVWAYLTTVFVRGWGAGEDPVSGWRLGAIGGALVIAALALVHIGGLLEVQNEIVFRAYGYATVVAFALGHLCLLAAFFVGLPALDDDEFEYDEDLEPGR